MSVTSAGHWLFSFEWLKVQSLELHLKQETAFKVENKDSYWATILPSIWYHWTITPTLLDNLAVSTCLRRRYVSYWSYHGLHRILLAEWWIRWQLRNLSNYEYSGNSEVHTTTIPEYHISGLVWYGATSSHQHEVVPFWIEHRTCNSKLALSCSFHSVFILETPLLPTKSARMSCLMHCFPEAPVETIWIQHEPCSPPRERTILI